MHPPYTRVCIQTQSKWFVGEVMVSKLAHDEYYNGYNGNLPLRPDTNPGMGGSSGSETVALPSWSESVNNSARQGQLLAHSDSERPAIVAGMGQRRAQEAGRCTYCTYQVDHQAS